MDNPLLPQADWISISVSSNDNHVLKGVSYPFLKWFLLALTFHMASAESTISTTAASSSCSYTVVINEFDVSKCAAMQEHIQADGVGVKTGAAGSNADIKLTKGKQNVSSRPSISGKSSEFKSRTVADTLNLDNQLQDVESKLLEEMVRSREINSTLNRHAMLLTSAQRTLESYRANFSSVFRTMMKMERKLQHQRRINRSLNKKLSNVILDVVEVNNVLTTKMTSSSSSSRTGKMAKKFSVESVGKVTSCPGFSKGSKVFIDCAAVYDAGHRRSDVYYIKPLYAACPIPVWCDMDSPKGGWLLIQRRKDGSVDFRRKWDEYRDGFGDVTGEHWLGNDNIFLLSNQARYQLRIDLWDFSGNRVYALYSNFKIEGERDEYRLHISGFGGSALDALHRHSNIKFSTVDRDNDNRREANCADEWEAGWWFDKCWVALLNGPYQNRSDVQWKGLAWNSWKREQLKASEMKIRPLINKRR